MKIGYFLSSEEWGPRDLIELAGKAERAGFEGLWISDHYHPWSDEQGHSPFVWAVIGALAEATSQKVTTAVTCPMVRIHPAVIAQAAATASILLQGRVCLGVGSGEALHEHNLGDDWPQADERLEMLEEAVEVIRALWQGGVQSHRGRHYRVEHARVYDLPDPPPPILVSGFGPKAIDVAAKIGDGFATVGPDADAVKRFRGGAKNNGTLVQGGLKVCWGSDEAQARQTAHRLWANDGLPGELAQVLPTTQHFEQASQLVTEEMIAEETPCGPDIDRHVKAVQEYADAGFDEVYVQQIGPEQDAFFEAYREHVLPRFH
jgi:G6PDH family F420-dependent oxidoreductase